MDDVNAGGIVGKLLALRNTPSSFASELSEEMTESERFQALPRFTKKAIMKYSDMVNSGKSVRESLLSIQFPGTISAIEIAPSSVNKQDCSVFEVSFQCLLWICQPTPRIETFECLLECLNALARSKFAKDVGDLFVLMCEDAFARLETWNENTLVLIVKHMFWNIMLGKEVGVFLPQVIEHASALNNSEVFQNVMSLVITLYESNKDVVGGCSPAMMMKALAPQLDIYHHNTLMLVSYLSHGPRCPEVDSFYVSIPSSIVEQITSFVVKNERLFPGHWSIEDTPPNLTAMQVMEAIQTRPVEPIVSFFPPPLARHVTNVKAMMENSSSSVVEGMLINSSDMMEKIVGYELSVGAAAFFVEILETLLAKTSGLNILKTLMRTAVFDGSVSVFGRKRLSKWTESVRRAFFATLAMHASKLIPDVIQLMREFPFVFAELLARMLNFVEAVDLYFFGNDTFLDSLLYVIKQLSNVKSESSNSAVAKEICLTFFLSLVQDSAIAQVCFVSSSVVDKLTDLVLSREIPDEFIGKLYDAIGRMPDLHPNVIDFACRICMRYLDSPSEESIVKNIVPLTKNIIQAAKSRLSVAKKIVPVYNIFVKSLEHRPSKEVLNNVLQMLTVVLPVISNYEVTPSLFTTLVEKCEEIYGKEPDESLFVKLMQIMGKSGDIVLGSSFLICAPEVAVLAVVIFRNSSLLDRILSHLQQLASVSEHNAIMLHRGKLDYFLLKALTGSVKWFGKDYSLKVSLDKEDAPVYQLIESIIRVKADYLAMKALVDAMNPTSPPPHPLTANLLKMVNRVRQTNESDPSPTFAIGHQAYIKSYSGFDLRSLNKGFLFSFFLKNDPLKMKALKDEFFLLGIADSMGQGVSVSIVGASVNVVYGTKEKTTTYSVMEACEGNVWRHYELVFKFINACLSVSCSCEGKALNEVDLGECPIAPDAAVTIGYLSNQVIESFDRAPPVKLGPFFLEELEAKDSRLLCSDSSSIPGSGSDIIQIMKDELTIEAILPILTNVSLLSNDELMNILELLALNDDSNYESISYSCVGSLNDMSRSLIQRLVGDVAVDELHHGEDSLCPDVLAMAYLLISRDESTLSFDLYKHLRVLAEKTKSTEILQCLLRKVLLNLCIWSKSPDFEAIMEDWVSLVKFSFPESAFSGVFERLLIQNCLLSGIIAYKKHEIEILEDIGHKCLSEKAVGDLISILPQIQDHDVILRYLQLLNRVIHESNKSFLLSSLPALLNCPLNEEIFCEIIGIIKKFPGPSSFQVITDLSHKFFPSQSLHRDIPDATICAIECIYHEEKSFPLEMLKKTTTMQSSFWYFWPVILGLLHKSARNDVCDFLIDEALQKHGEMSRCLTSIYYVLLILDHFRVFNCDDFRKQFVANLTVTVKSMVGKDKQFYFGHAAEKLFVLAVCRLVDPSDPDSLEKTTPFFYEHPFSFETLKSMCYGNLSNAVLKPECTEHVDRFGAIVNDFRELLELANHEKMLDTQIRDCINMKPENFDKITEGIRGRLAIAIHGLHSNLIDSLNKIPTIKSEDIFQTAKYECLGELHDMLLQGQCFIHERTAQKKLAFQATFRSNILHGEIPATRTPSHFREIHWLVRLQYCNLDINVTMVVNRDHIHLWHDTGLLMEMRISDIRIVQYHRNQNSLEIYTGSCESLYVTFSEGDYNEAEQILKAIGFPSLEEHSVSIQQIVMRWINEQISNLDLIVAANILAGKSFHDENNSVIYPHFKPGEMTLPPPGTRKLVGVHDTSGFVGATKFINSRSPEVRAAIHRWVDDNFQFDIPDMKFRPPNDANAVAPKKFRLESRPTLCIFGSGEVFGVLDANGKFSVITLIDPSICRCLAQNETGLGEKSIGCCYNERFVLYDPDRLLLGKKFESGYQEQEMCHGINFMAFCNADTIVTIIDHSEIALTSLGSFPDQRHVIRYETDYIVTATISTEHDVIAYVTSQNMLTVLNISTGVELLRKHIQFERVKRISVTHNYGFLVIECVNEIFSLSLSGCVINRARISYPVTVQAHDLENDFVVGTTDTGAIEYFVPQDLCPRVFSSRVPNCVALAQTHVLVTIQENGDLSVFPCLSVE